MRPPVEALKLHVGHYADNVKRIGKNAIQRPAATLATGIGLTAVALGVPGCAESVSASISSENRAAYSRNAQDLTPNPLGSKRVYGENTTVSDWNGLMGQFEREKDYRQQQIDSSFAKPQSGEYSGVARYNSQLYFSIGRAAVAADISNVENYLNGAAARAGVRQRARIDDVAVYDGTVPQSNEPQNYIGVAGANRGARDFMGIFDPSGIRLSDPAHPYSTSNRARYLEAASGILRLQRPTEGNIGYGDMAPSLRGRMNINLQLAGATITDNQNWFKDDFLADNNTTTSNDFGPFNAAQLNYRDQYEQGDMLQDKTILESNNWDDIGPDLVDLSLTDMSGAPINPATITGVRYFSPTITSATTHFVYDVALPETRTVNVPIKNILPSTSVLGGTTIVEVVINNGASYRHGVVANPDRNMAEFQKRTATTHPTHIKFDVRTMGPGDTYNAANFFNRGNGGVYQDVLDGPAPTATPLPTDTPRPTATPAPTDTPRPTPDATPTPPPTPGATDTPTPVNTPQAINSPTPRPIPTAAGYREYVVVAARSGSFANPVGTPPPDRTRTYFPVSGKKNEPPTPIAIFDTQKSN